MYCKGVALDALIKMPTMSWRCNTLLPAINNVVLPPPAILRTNFYDKWACRERANDDGASERAAYFKVSPVGMRRPGTQWDLADVEESF